MGQRKSRLTLGRLMAVIGIIALGFAMSRVDAAPAVSICVFTACTWYLANRRYTEALARRTAEGVSVGASQKALIAVLCTFTAAFAIGLPDAAFLGGYYGYMEWARRASLRATDIRWAPELELTNILFGALIGTAAALYVATLMRRGSHPAAKKRTAKAANRTPSQPPVGHERVVASCSTIAARA